MSGTHFLGWRKAKIVTGADFFLTKTCKVRQNDEIYERGQSVLPFSLLRTFLYISEGNLTKHRENVRDL